MPQCVTTLRPRQNDRHFAADTFKYILLNKKVWISFAISPKFTLNGSVNNIPALVQISHYLNQWWLIYWLIYTSLGIHESNPNIVKSLCLYLISHLHYSDVILNVMVSQTTSVSIVYWTVCSGADQRKHQSSASRAFVRVIHRWPVKSPHKVSVTRKVYPCDDVIMTQSHHCRALCKISKWLGD